MTLHQTSKPDPSRVRQGDIFRSVQFFESYRESAGNLEVVMLEFPYALVLTQDCDLEQNKSAREAACQVPAVPQSNDKHLVSVLVAPVYNFEHVVSGEHLLPLGIASQRFNSSQKSSLKTNQLARFHYFEFDTSAALPNSVVDFKHYFSVALEALEGRPRDCVCGIGPLYRELVSQRFSNYLSRIGLPEPSSTA
jgi:hypothetical protein